ncbi:hypothetical protein B296_00046483 [Ensete ventricosum]|uniref:40S ribosomal protein S30 n=1 Tax=Ensete ventricosum TaxID=4639 RepID=A0A426X4A9_ENSVE|nr:hypothetical protein B296_00046483 [Ensete ventricosum]
MSPPGILMHLQGTCQPWTPRLYIFVASCLEQRNLRPEEQPHRRGLGFPPSSVRSQPPQALRDLVHGSLARAGKVRGQTPKMEKKDKPKDPRGRAFKRKQYTRRFVTAGCQGSAVGGAGEDKRAVGGGRSTRHCPPEEEGHGCVAAVAGDGEEAEDVGFRRSIEEEEDGSARCVLPRDGLQIGKTTLSFDSKKITMAIGGSTKKVLWHIAMLCFVGKQRSLLEKSTSGWLQPSVVGKQRSLLEEADSCVATVEGHD